MTVHPASLGCYIVTGRSGVAYRYSDGEKTFEQTSLERVPANFRPTFDAPLRRLALEVVRTPGLPDRLAD